VETGSGPRRGRGWPLVALVLGGAALLAAIVGIAVSEPREGEVEITGVAEAQQTLGGLRQDGPFIGSPEAPVTVEVYNDLHCASCAGWELRTIPPLVESLVRDRRARLRFRHFPMSERERSVGALASASAALQDREWQYLTLFFANQAKVRETGVTDQFLRQVASSVSDLSLADWDTDRDSPEVERRLTADAAEALRLHLPAEPAAVVLGPRGTRKLVESPSAVEIEAAVRSLAG
jgi:protein-disulfide isomerase